METGQLVSERIKRPTPKPSTPESVAETVADVVGAAGWDGPIGCALPAVVRGGIVETAVHIDPAWIGTDATGFLAGRLNRPVTVMNDADAAGIAEMEFGAGRDHPARDGVVVLLTFGTGIGSALLAGGRLVPNTELGHLRLWGGSAEVRASANAKEAEGLGWKAWAERVSEYLQYVESLLWPDLFLIGGGISNRSKQFLHRIETRAPVVPAALRNNAGIAGAALASAREMQP